MADDCWVAQQRHRLGVGHHARERLAVEEGLNGLRGRLELHVFVGNLGRRIALRHADGARGGTADVRPAVDEPDAEDDDRCGGQTQMTFFA